MRLLPLETPELIERAASWLVRKENYQWLDFGGGRADRGRVITPALLKIMALRETHFLRVYTTQAEGSGAEDLPIGIIGLNDVNRAFGTGVLWMVAGETSFRRRGYTTLATSRFLTLAFRDLGLHAISTWAVEHNHSIRMLERLNFRLIGRQRQCHYIDDRCCDRLLFDLLASEHRELQDVRPLRTQVSKEVRVRAERA
jgi:RimJ/RimL family protein N-acetyltransferase